MTLTDVLNTIIVPAMKQLPAGMDSIKARLMLLCIGLQESRFVYRRQLGNGPARGFWQFELGTQASRGGVWGVYLHPLTTHLLQDLCVLHKVTYNPPEIWAALETNDIFACCVARLMLYTDAAPLPDIGDVAGAWQCYAVRVWRPGKPIRSTWDNYYAQARAALGA